MKKKIIGIFICMLLIATLLPMNGIVSSYCSNTNRVIFQEIDETEDKILIVNEVIGDRHVKYWEHAIDDIFVKNDSILLHMNIENHLILHYERSWTEIDIDLSPALDDSLFEPEDYFWKKAVMFTDNNDCTYFYNFHESQEFPLFCWEVRHNDGTTIMYDSYGYEIGYGTSAPSSGFLLSGYHNESLPDPWLNWRLNAEYWFDKWCTLTTGISAPTPETISYYVSNQNYELFYEMAHGNHYLFQADSTGSHYYSWDVANDMNSRSPMKFAFIGSCDGMNHTGPGSFSHEFRKGQMTDTVTIGYSGMGSCPGWSVSHQWQDYMFNKMDEEYTIKESFDLASAEYPIIADCVVFVGDENLAIENKKPYSPSNPSPKNHAIDVDVNADLSWTCGDPNEGDTVTYDIYFGDVNPPPLEKIDHPDTSYNLGTMDFSTTYYWYIIARDNHGFSRIGPLWEFTTASEDTNKPPNKPTIHGSNSGKPGTEYEYTFNAVDPDGDNVKYHIEWGDTQSETTAFSSSGTNVKVSHTWSTGGTYTIKATAEDSNGLVGPEGTLSVSMPRNRATQRPFLKFLEQYPILYQLLLRFLRL